MLTELAINLIAALIGFLVAQAYFYLRQIFSKRDARWFWVPTPSARIYLHYGEWNELLSEFGEVESVVNVVDALTLGEIRVFLDSYYSEIVVTRNVNSIDWQYPVVTIGGPLPNSLTREIGEQGLLPLWFLDMPYSKTSRRAIGSAGRVEVFRPAFNEVGQLVIDVGFVARMRSPRNKQQFLYVIAGTYGVGTLGVVRHLTSFKKLYQLRRMNNTQHFQAIIRSDILEGRIIDAELVHYRGLD